MTPYIGLFYLIIAHVFGLDKPKEFTLFGVSYAVIVSILCLFMLTMAMSFLTRRLAYPRSILIVSSGLQILFLVPWHLFINKRYLKSNVRKTVLVVGYDKAFHLARKLLNSTNLWSNIKKICRPESIHLHKHILDYNIVFLADDVDEEIKQDIAKYCVLHNKEFYYEPRIKEIFLFNADFVQIEDIPVLRTMPFEVSANTDLIKRILDIFLALVGVVIFAIPAAIVTISLKMGGGSALYKQERVTRGGKVFMIYKFRTMVENAEAASGPTLANASDSRITKLGHFLRSTRLDEIPQLYNILTGDMSVVGPRPERPFFVEQFNKEIPEYNLRHKVKTGLTGLAQVQGKYNTSVRDKLKYDLLYINGYSLALDIKLIMQTLTILLKKSSTEGVKEWSNYEELINELTEKE